MSNLSNLAIQTGAYCFVFIGSLLIMNFITKGYVIPYILVKASRGKKILIRIFGLTGRYYKPGQLVGTKLKFKDRAGDKNTLTNVSAKNVYDEMGIKVIDYDEVQKRLVDQITFTDEDSNDPVKVDDLIERALQKPALQDKKDVIIIALCILILLGLAALLYMVYQVDINIRGLSVIGGV